jgi:hypothetical protein
VTSAPCPGASGGFWRVAGLRRRGGDNQIFSNTVLGGIEVRLAAQNSTRNRQISDHSPPCVEDGRFAIFARKWARRSNKMRHQIPWDHRIAGGNFYISIE